jgi:hypothetical protein
MLRVELANETIQDRSCRDVLMKRERPENLKRKKNPEDDIILWKVKQMCSQFDHQLPEFTRKIMMENQENPSRSILFSLRYSLV